VNEASEWVQEECEARERERGERGERGSEEVRKRGRERIG
jgi:hypothetical protein